MKNINGHTFECGYSGVVEFYIDGKVCWDGETAAKWLEITVEQFMEMDWF